MEALFGGSFDPVHVCHLVAAEAAGEALGATGRFLPARGEPVKPAAPAGPPDQAGRRAPTVATRGCPRRFRRHQVADVHGIE